MNIAFNHLSQLLGHAASIDPDQIAIEAECGQIYTYRALDLAADRVSTRLARWGVGRGDRVGVFLPKSFASVAAIHGILRSGAAYVPIDPAAPVMRGTRILADAGVKVIVVEGLLADDVRRQWTGAGSPPRLMIVEPESTLPSTDAAWTDVLADLAPSPLAPTVQADDLAYILYTSGSTGTPKGVMLSHRNAFTFLDWCAATFDLSPKDRFSSHAPFHFDLSVFDLYASCRVGATLVLIGESLGKDPARLGLFFADRKLSVWYSAPSALSLLTEYGGIDHSDFPSPRIVLFAGEVFPISPLKRLRSAWPEATLWNLYGPTETNVCTALRIPQSIPDDRSTPFPIGSVCLPLNAKVVDESGRRMPHGLIGELAIAGPGVMRGYFGLPELTARVFFTDQQGTSWYRTGDLAVDDGSGSYQFHGRRDRMVKKRGYRIELGEIEAAIYSHPGVDRAAVVARHGDSGVSIAAFVAMKPGQRGSIIAMKRHCAGILPGYMVPDAITFLSDLPTTSTDKVDYQGLKRMLVTAGA